MYSYLRSKHSAAHCENYGTDLSTDMLNLTCVIRCKTLFIAKDVLLRRGLSSARFKESLQYRILNYFETSRKSQQTAQQCEISAQSKHIVPTINNDLLDLNKAKKLDTIYREFNHILTINDMDLVQEMIENLDLKCFALINSLTISEILSLMTEFLKVAPTQFVKSFFYDRSISILFKAAEEKSLTNHESVQLLYFISLHKENSANYIDYLKPLLPDMNDLPLFEKCITAQSFYKTSTKLQLRQSRLLEQLIERDFEQLIGDPMLLVTVCKAIILSEPSSELTLKHLSKAIIELKEPLNFNSVAHVLRLYAETLLFEPKPIDKLVKCGIDIIAKDLEHDTLSIPDVDTFLWSISYLGITLTLNEKLILRAWIEQNLRKYKTRENLGYLVNSLLCLHMLRGWSTKVIKNCLGERTFEPIFYDKFHWKVQSRLQLLISQIRLEMKMQVPHPLTKQIKIGFTPSQNLQAVVEVGYSLANKGIIKDAIIECPIKTLIIPGVTITTKKDTYHVDVLDNLTCLKKTNIPTGLTNLKLRLLSRLRYRQILIQEQIFKENPEKVPLIVEEKIRNSIKYGRASELFSENMTEI
ncbi:hypothetical protein TSAR_006265 [Trichomalopsis sarcophagae]|uniref:RAP domain-containing protein n=1 Tax=Trichomalopsis sarcophagae TaxID=543379 RepID=A0A232F092_9HYME|nr:hypothetical protein TSAR_006265 [Trichomalopsis sarcophagae]